VVKEGPEAFGHGKDELAHGHMGKDVVHQVSRGLGHALRAAGGAGSSALARREKAEEIAVGFQEWQAARHRSAAAELGRKGGQKGGKARAEALSAERRKEIAKNAAEARWRKGDPER
jgi:hypothetical protein